MDGDPANPARRTRSALLSIDDYLADVPEPQRTTLTSLRATLRTLLPDADEALKYSSPTFVVEGKNVAGFAAFADHCSYLPFSPAVLDEAADDIAGYERSKGVLRFPVDRPLPTDLVARLVALRLAELGIAGHS